MPSNNRPILAKASKPSTLEKSAKLGQKGFSKGLSGNLNGRPKGSRNKINLIVQQLIDENAEEIIGKLIEQAKGGNIPALKFLAERYVPPMRTRPIGIALVNISAMEGLASVWRYEDRLHNQRKNALAMLLRLQGK